VSAIVPTSLPPQIHPRSAGASACRRPLPAGIGSIAPFARASFTPYPSIERLRRSRAPETVRINPNGPPKSLNIYPPTHSNRAPERVRMAPLGPPMLMKIQPIAHFNRAPERAGHRGDFRLSGFRTRFRPSPATSEPPSVGRRFRAAAGLLPGSVPGPGSPESRSPGVHGRNPGESWDRLTRPSGDSQLRNAAISGRIRARGKGGSGVWGVGRAGKGAFYWCSERFLGNFEWAGSGCPKPGSPVGNRFFARRINSLRMGLGL
jgi:hypothetical protein